VHLTSISSSSFGSDIPQHVLIVGGDSTIGSALNKRLLVEGYQVTCTTRRPGGYGNSSLYLDLEDPTSISSLKYRHFDVTVLCGAITSIQKCEKNPEQTRQVNVTGTMAVADLLRESGSHLVFLSTNMVFDGSKPKAKSTDTRCPLTEYGKQKAAVEEVLLAARRQASIIRLGKVLPRNFSLFKQWIKELRTGNCIYPYANITMAPISLAFAIDILSWLIDKKSFGVFQATASCDITYEEAAFFLAKLSQSDSSLIKPINASLNDARNGICSPPIGFNSLEFSAELLSSFAIPMSDQALKYAFY